MTRCDYCSQTALGVHQWRQSSEVHERIPGYQPNPEGRGIHRLCLECSKALEAICTFFKSKLL